MPKAKLWDLGAATLEWNTMRIWTCQAIGKLAHHFRHERGDASEVNLENYTLMKSIRDPKRRPTQPGDLLRQDVLPALEITQTELAKRLGVSG